MLTWMAAAAVEMNVSDGENMDFDEDRPQEIIMLRHCQTTQSLTAGLLGGKRFRYNFVEIYYPNNSIPFQ